jgi:hypothetical protein
MGIRVSPEEEWAGLDIGEHGITAYPEFQSPVESLPGERISYTSEAVVHGRLAVENEES